MTGDLAVDDFAEPACRVCGCTENAACPGGCWWVPDPEMLGELCSACAERPSLVDDGPPEPDCFGEWPEAEEPRRPVDRVHDAKGRV